MMSKVLILLKGRFLMFSKGLRMVSKGRFWPFGLDRRKVFLGFKRGTFNCFERGTFNGFKRDCLKVLN